MILEEKKNFIINFLYFTFWFVIFYLIFKVAFLYLLPFLFGIIIASVVQKPADIISKRIKIKKEICASFLSVICYIAVVCIISALVWILYTQFSELIEQISNYSGSIISFFENFYNHFKILFNSLGDGLKETINNFSQNTVNTLISKVTSLFSALITTFIKKLPSLFVSIVVTVVATCYIAKDYERLLSFLRGIIGAKSYQKANDFYIVIKNCLFKFIIGYFWLFVITFFQLLFGFLLLGIKHFVALAFLVAFLDLLPIIGTATILIPWSIFMFFIGDFSMGLGLLLLLVFIVVVRNYAEPKIIGKQMGINPLFTLVFIFVGLRFGGFLGMLILPITLTALFNYYRQKYNGTDV